MSTSLDPNRVKGPALEPSDVPDEKTQKEEDELRVRVTKSPTPTQQLVVSHLAHTSSLENRIEHHCNEIATLRAEISEIRKTNDGHATAIAKAGEYKGRLEDRLQGLGWFGLLGNVSVILGGGGVSLAGAGADLSAWQKTVCAYGGAGALLVGALIGVVASIRGLIKPRQA